MVGILDASMLGPVVEIAPAGRLPESRLYPPIRPGMRHHQPTGSLTTIALHCVACRETPHNPAIRIPVHSGHPLQTCRQ